MTHRRSNARLLSVIHLEAPFKALASYETTAIILISLSKET